MTIVHVANALTMALCQRVYYMFKRWLPAKMAAAPAVSGDFYE